MYWNNPLINLTYPSDQDPIMYSFHDGVHCLFYDPAVEKNLIKTAQHLQDLCDWANMAMSDHGNVGFVQESVNHYDIANLVKLNIWRHDLSARGNIKPMLLQYVGDPMFLTGTGESRLRAMERIHQIQTVSAFISTHRRYEKKFEHLESVTSFERFAEICQATKGQEFLFRLTDRDAPYGLDWYEYNSQLTATVTPGQEYCVEVMAQYLKQHADLIFTPEWFDQIIDWNAYKNS